MARPARIEEPRRTSAYRLPESLHEQVKAAAAERGMSMNDLLIIALEDVLPRLLPPGEIRWTRPAGTPDA